MVWPTLGSRTAKEQYRTEQQLVAHGHVKVKKSCAAAV